MTEKVWCRREKRIMSAAEKVAVWIGIIGAIGIVAFCFGAMIGYLTGFIPVPSNPNDGFLTAAGLIAAMAILIIGFAAVICADESKGENNMFLQSNALLLLALIMSGLAAVTEIMRFNSIAGYAVIVSMIIIGPIVFTHIKCEEEKFLAGEKK